MCRFVKFAALSLSSLALLSACGEPAGEGETADDYAARLNGKASAQDTSRSTSGSERGQGAPNVATPPPGAAPGPFEPGTQTDPQAAACGAPDAAPAVGQSYAQAEVAIRDALPSGASVRVVRPGQATTEDYNPRRLNVMLDAGGVVRDLRCG